MSADLNTLEEFGMTKNFAFSHPLGGGIGGHPTAIHPLGGGIGGRTINHPLGGGIGGNPVANHPLGGGIGG